MSFTVLYIHLKLFHFQCLGIIQWLSDVLISWSSILDFVSVLWNFILLSFTLWIFHRMQRILLVFSINPILLKQIFFIKGSLLPSELTASRYHLGLEQWFSTRGSFVIQGIYLVMFRDTVGWGCCWHLEVCFLEGRGAALHNKELLNPKWQ